MLKGSKHDEFARARMSLAAKARHLRENGAHIKRLCGLAWSPEAAAKRAATIETLPPRPRVYIDKDRYFVYREQPMRNPLRAWNDIIEKAHKAVEKQRAERLAARVLERLQSSLPDKR